MTLHVDIIKWILLKKKKKIHYILGSNQEEVAVYSQEKQTNNKTLELEFTVTQLIKFSWENSGLN